VRILVILFSLFLAFSTTARLRAADPAAQQDAEAAREKLLKASDQLENIQANSESTKNAVDGMKADVTKLQADLASVQTENATLKQQLADLRTSFEKAEAAHAKERQVLIDSVADLIKQQSSGSAKSTSAQKKKPEKSSTDSAASTPPPAKSPAPETNSSGTSLKPPPDPAPEPTTASSEASPAKPQKGYYHIVASGETLRLICNAYKQDGVNVTVSDIQKANGLTDKSVLKVGQKLFIPKPGT